MIGVLAKGTPRVEITASVPSIAAATRRVVNIAGGNLEARVLDRERVGMAGERDHVVVLVERQLGEESSGGAIRPEHGKFHELGPFDAHPWGEAGTSTRTTAPSGV